MFGFEQTINNLDERVQERVVGRLFSNLESFKFLTEPPGLISMCAV